MEGTRVIATPYGLAPTVTVATTVLVAVAITDTVPPPALRPRSTRLSPGKGGAASRTGFCAAAGGGVW